MDPKETQQTVRPPLWRLEEAASFYVTFYHTLPRNFTTLLYNQWVAHFDFCLMYRSEYRYVRLDGLKLIISSRQDHKDAQLFPLNSSCRLVRRKFLGRSGEVGAAEAGGAPSPNTAQGFLRSGSDVIGCWQFSIQNDSDTNTFSANSSEERSVNMHNFNKSIYAPISVPKLLCRESWLSALLLSTSVCHEIADARVALARSQVPADVSSRGAEEGTSLEIRRKIELKTLIARRKETKPNSQLHEDEMRRSSVEYSKLAIKISKASPEVTCVFVRSDDLTQNECLHTPPTPVGF